MNEQLYVWMSVGAIAWGLLDCFFGYRVFKITLAVVGGLLGLLLAQAASTALRFGAGTEVIVMIVGGLLGASVAFLLYKGAVFVAGFGFGATLGVLLLTHYNDMVALMSGVVLGIVGGFLAVKLQRVLIILSTALLGSFRTILAIAYFTGKVDWIYYYQQPQQMPALIDNNAWMLPSVLGLAVIGAIAQFEMDGSFAKKKNPARNE
jgi:hypothetical protein